MSLYYPVTQNGLQKSLGSQLDDRKAELEAEIASIEAFEADAQDGD